MNVSLPGLIILAILSCGQISSRKEANPAGTQLSKDTCDDPDAPVSCSFVNMPAPLSHTLSMASKDEPGERLVITGNIFKEDGKSPYPGVLIYAYQTDSKGLYSKKGTERGAQKWHGRLHGWCKTDSNGYYKIETVRPARYPDNSMPAHIHAAIRKEDGNMYWVSDFVFKDDALVNEKYLSTIRGMVGETGVAEVYRNTDNEWIGKRDIVLTK